MVNTLSSMSANSFIKNQHHLNLWLNTKHVLQDAEELSLFSRILTTKSVLQLQLIFFSGLLRSNAYREEEFFGTCVKTISRSLCSLLSSSYTEVQSLAIEVAELWIVNSISHIWNNDSFHPIVQQLCLSVLLHWDSDDQLTITVFKHFLATLLPLCLSASSAAYPISWVRTHLVHRHILRRPESTMGSVILPKGVLYCLGPLLSATGPVWLLENCPNLVTSLLISLGHNYTGATAADFLMQLIDDCVERQLSNHPVIIDYVIIPIARYCDEDWLDCTPAQFAHGWSDCSTEVIHQSRRVNFADHCMRRSLLQLRLKIEPISGTCVSIDMPLAKWLLYRLAKPREPSKDSIEKHRLFLWLVLFDKVENKLSLLNSQDADLTPLWRGLCHPEDRLCALAFLGLAGLSASLLHPSCNLSLIPHVRQESKILSSPKVAYGSALQFSLERLSNSTDAVARKMISTGFAVWVRALRNASASSLDSLSWEFAARRLQSRVMGLDEQLNSLRLAIQSEPVTFDRTVLARQWLADLYEFTVGLWMHPNAGDSRSASVHAFWPGMTYQRAKIRLELMYQAIGLLHLDRAKPDLPGQWRTGYAQSTILKLQQFTTRLAQTFGWDYKSCQSFHQLIQCLPILQADLQVRLLQLFSLIWPEGIPSDLPESDRSHLMHLALQWSDSNALIYYTAGSNLVNFLCKSTKPVTLYPTLETQILNRLTAMSEASCLSGTRLLNMTLKASGIGYLITVDALLTSFRKRECPSQLTELLESTQLVELVQRLCNQCLVIMGCKAWEPGLEGGGGGGGEKDGHGATSFRQLAQSILRVTLDDQPCNSEGNHARNSNEAEPTVKQGTEAIQWLPEYQHILSWAWNTLRWSASILSHWSIVFANVVPPSEAHLCLRNCIGEQLLHILLHCRHRGTVEAVSGSLQLYLTHVKPTTEEALPIAIDDVVSSDPSLATCANILQLCWNVLHNRGYSVTRRAAGLWPAVKAGLLASRAIQGRRAVPVLLLDWINRLIDLTQPSGPKMSVPTPDPSGDHGNRVQEAGDGSNDMTDPPQALALHLLRGVFADSTLRPDCYPAVGDESCNSMIHALRCAVLPSFANSEWTVSNAALQLHGALVHRLTGSNSGRPTPSINDVFGKYPQLFTICLDELKKLSTSHPVGTQSTATLIPLLTLLTRLSCDSHLPDELFMFKHARFLQLHNHISDLQNLNFENLTLCQYPCLTQCPSEIKFRRMRAVLRCLLLDHPCLTVRRLAATAYAAFVPTELYQSVLIEMASIGPLPLLTGPPLLSVWHTQHGWANALHGQCCLLHTWFTQPVSEGILRERQNYFDWSVALKFLNRLLGPTGPINAGAAYLAKLLLNLLCVINKSFPIADNIRQQVYNWIHARPTAALFQLSPKPFHLETSLAMYRLTKVYTATYCESVVEFYIPNSTDPALLMRFLSLSDNSDLVTLVLNLINFWLHHEQHNALALHRTQPQLCWRIVELWAARLLSGSPSSLVIDRARDSDRLVTMLQSLAMSDAVIGSRDCVHQAKIVVCLIDLINWSDDDLIPMWWLDSLKHSLDPSAPEPARQIAASALILWVQRYLSHADGSPHCWLIQHTQLDQRQLLLHIVFFALFDEDAHIRATVSSFICKCPPEIEWPIPCTSSLSVRHLLDRVAPLLFEQSADILEQWLSNLWLVVMSDLNERIVDEQQMRQRNALYERELDNNLCDSTELLELICSRIVAVRSGTQSKSNCAILAKRLIQECEQDLKDRCLAHSIQFENTQSSSRDSPSIHQITPAVYARDLGMCLLSQHLENSIHSLEECRTTPSL